MNYMVTDTGVVFTKDELRQCFEQFKDEAKEKRSFDDWFDDMLMKGMNGTGGLVETEKGAY